MDKQINELYPAIQNVLIFLSFVFVVSISPIELETKVHKVCTITEKAHSVNVNVKEQIGAFNEEKAQVGAFSMIVKLKSSRSFVSSSGEMSRGRPRGCCTHANE